MQRSAQTIKYCPVLSDLWYLLFCYAFVQTPKIIRWGKLCAAGENLMFLHSANVFFDWKSLISLMNFGGNPHPPVPFPFLHLGSLEISRRFAPVPLPFLHLEVARDFESGGTRTNGNGNTHYECGFPKATSKLYY